MKSKDIHIRVDPENFNLMKEYADFLNSTLTDLIENSVFNTYLIRIEKVPNIDKELYRDISSMSNNLNQCARALNQIAKMLTQQSSSYLLINRLDVLSATLKELNDSFNQVLEQTRVQEMGLYHFLKHRELNPSFEKFLKQYDSNLLNTMSDSI